MSEISSISGSQKLTSKPRASMEKMAPEQTKGMQESKDVEKLKVRMYQVNQAFALVKEIRHSLEQFLEEL